jgi:anti-anti-sigma factor
MSRNSKAFVLACRVNQSGGFMNVVRGPCSNNVCVLHVVGPLRAPLNGELRHRVLALVRNGKRTIVLDLAHVPRIDAAGVGQLVRAYNLTVRKNGMLTIVHATAWVREILHRAGLFDLLSGGWGPDERAARTLVPRRAQIR